MFGIRQQFTDLVLGETCAGSRPFARQVVAQVPAALELLVSNQTAQRAGCCEVCTVVQVSRGKPFGECEWLELKFLGENMAITSIGRPLTLDLTQSTASAARKELAAKMLADMDTDQDGKVSKAEFTGFGETMKASGAARQPPAGGAQMPSANSLFSSADTDGSQALSVDELSAMLAEGETRAQASGGPGGAGPGGGGMGGPAGAGPAGGGGAGASSSTSSSSDTDPADANQDGTVSATEQLMYELTHPNAAEAQSA